MTSASGGFLSLKQGDDIYQRGLLCGSGQPGTVHVQ